MSVSLSKLWHKAVSFSSPNLSSLQKLSPLITRNTLSRQKNTKKNWRILCTHTLYNTPYQSLHVRIKSLKKTWERKKPNFFFVVSVNNNVAPAAVPNNYTITFFLGNKEHSRLIKKKLEWASPFKNNNGAVHSIFVNEVLRKFVKIRSSIKFQIFMQFAHVLWNKII